MIGESNYEEMAPGEVPVQDPSKMENNENVVEAMPVVHEKPRKKIKYDHPNGITHNFVSAQETNILLNATDKKIEEEVKAFKEEIKAPVLIPPPGISIEIPCMDSDGNALVPRKGDHGHVFCDLCQISCCDDNLFSMHLAGKKHKTKLAEFHKNGGVSTPKKKRAAAEDPKTPTQSVPSTPTVATPTSVKTPKSKENPEMDDFISKIKAVVQPLFNSVDFAGIGSYSKNTMSRKLNVADCAVMLPEPTTFAQINERMNSATFPGKFTSYNNSQRFRIESIETVPGITPRKVNLLFTYVNAFNEDPVCEDQEFKKESQFVMCAIKHFQWFKQQYFSPQCTKAIKQIKKFRRNHENEWHCINPWIVDVLMFTVKFKYGPKTTSSYIWDFFSYISSGALLHHMSADQSRCQIALRDPILSEHLKIHNDNVNSLSNIDEKTKQQLIEKVDLTSSWSDQDRNNVTALAQQTLLRLAPAYASEKRDLAKIKSVMSSH